jgi:hypothetical protein
VNELEEGINCLLRCDARNSHDGMQHGGSGQQSTAERILAHNNDKEALHVSHEIYKQYSIIMHYDGI